MSVELFLCYDRTPETTDRSSSFCMRKYGLLAISVVLVVDSRIRAVRAQRAQSGGDRRDEGMCHASLMPIVWTQPHLSKRYLTCLNASVFPQICSRVSKLLRFRYVYAKIARPHQNAQSAYPVYGAGYTCSLSSRLHDPHPTELPRIVQRNIPQHVWRFHVQYHDQPILSDAYPE